MSIFGNENFLPTHLFSTYMLINFQKNVQPTRLFDLHVYSVPWSRHYYWIIKCVKNYMFFITLQLKGLYKVSDKNNPFHKNRVTTQCTVMQVVYTERVLIFCNFWFQNLQQGLKLNIFGSRKTLYSAQKYLNFLFSTGFTKSIQLAVFISITSQRWKFKLSVPGRYKNTIPTPLGLPWLSSYQKLSAEHKYIGFVLIISLKVQTICNIC